MDWFSGQRTFIGMLLMGCLITLAATPWVIRLAWLCKALDDPGVRKVHARVKPRWGGLALFLGTWLPVAMLAFWRNDVTFRLTGNALEMALICFSGFAMLILGMLDDRFGLRSRWKLAAQIPVAIAVVYCGITITRISVPFLGVVELGGWGSILAVLWIVGITNALNLIDGLDGLAAGVAFFVAATNAVIAVYTTNDVLAVVMCALAGSCPGFLRYNFAPARIFLGDAGSLFIGMTLAVTSLAANAKSTVTMSLLIPVVVLGYPVLDTFLAIARRAVRGKPIFSSDRAHIHHRLLAAGLDHRRASMLLYGFCLLLSVLGLAVLWQNHVVIFAAMVILLGVLFVGARTLGYFERFAVRNLVMERPLYRIANLAAQLALAKLDASNSPGEIFRALQGLGEEFKLAEVRLWCRGEQFRHSFSEAKREHADGANDSAGGAIRLQSTGGGIGVTLSISEAWSTDDLAVEHRGLLQEVAQATLARLQQLPSDSSEQPDRGRKPEDAALDAARAGGEHA
ncbi:MAG: hypothetical protein AMXMBFR7_50800 [Planctomycetota bacterium]